MRQFFSALLTIGLLAVAVPAAAQRPRAEQRDTAKRTTPTPVPTDARPPKGMCRIWVDGVPAAQQPAATDCPTAVKNRPANARVIFGDEYADSSKAKPATRNKLPADVKGFTGMKTPPPPLLPKRPPE
ncbi:MAG TPA: hypothetical protein VGM67_13015 [Gemmatimonadaceae bacterium]|jgi:hypothetical protein